MVTVDWREGVDDDGLRYEEEEDAAGRLSIRERERARLARRNAGAGGSIRRVSWLTGPLAGWQAENQKMSRELSHEREEGIETSEKRQKSRQSCTELANLMTGHENPHAHRERPAEMQSLTRSREARALVGSQRKKN